MPDPQDWTVVLSGPLTHRGPLLASLQQAGITVEPDQGPRGNPYGLPDDDPTLGWVACRHTDLNDATAASVRCGWALRMHWPTPACWACAGTGRVNGPDGLGACLHCTGNGHTNKPLPPPEQQMAERLAALEARLADMEGRR